MYLNRSHFLLGEHAPEGMFRERLTYSLQEQ